MALAIPRMTEFPTSRSEGRPAGPESAAGLRLRLWLACLGGALVAAAGIWWVIGTRIGPAVTPDPATLVLWLAGSGALGIVTGALLALWLDARILGALRGLTRALASQQVHELRGLPAASGWGEISDLTQQVQHLIAAHRQAGRAGEELRHLQHQVAALSVAVERWIASERWEPLRLEAGPLATLAASLDRGFAREVEVGEQNQEAVRLVRVELEASLGDARESVEQAERGFVEATALITTVRELQRLGGELRDAIQASGLETGASPPVAEAIERYRAAAAAAIGELVAAAGESVERLAAGLARVSEIAEIVHTLANRATLIALNAVIASGRGGAAARHPEELTAELKALAGEVRAATERTDALSREVEREVAAASARMREVRERIAGRLDEAPPPAGAIAGVPENVLRLHERVSEMIQDAAQKGERLSAAGERASRAAERLLRRLEEEAREMEGLVLRLGSAAALPEEPRVPAGAAGPPARPAGLRLLEPGEGQTGEEPETRGREERP